MSAIVDLSKATPRPWEIGPRKGRYRAMPASQQEATGLAAIGHEEFDALSIGVPFVGQVALIPLDESNEANAALIVKAVNERDDLIAALRIAAARIDDTESSDDAEFVRAVLARADVL